MSTTKKVLIIISAIVLLAAFIFAITWGIINWSKVKEGMKGNGLYTQEDIQKSYEDGFNKALSDKDEYEKLINSYKDTITTQNDLISQHTSEVAILNNSIKDYTEQVKILSEQRTALETQISTLTDIKSNNERTISELNKQIDNLSNQVVILQGNATENATQIESLNNQISSLQAINSQLKNTNELNTETITALNNQNTALNNQIAELNQQIQNDFSIVGTLTNKITELEKSVQYYEKYLESITQGELVMATFEFNGSVYNVQMVNKNSTISVTQPQSTEYVIFNGWMVDGEIVDLSSYTITENTRFIANITLKFDIKFFADGENIQSSIMVKDSKITPPEAPIKVGYVFEGWTVDGSLIINFDTYSVNQNVTFTAKYVKQYLVKFEYEGTVISSQTITSGHCAELPEAPNTTYKVFNGWKMNGAIVDALNYKINANTTFVADITYKFDAIFKVDNVSVDSQLVTKNTSPILPKTPIKAGFVFIGWSLDGTEIVDLSNYIITEHTTFIAVFRADKFTVTFKNGDNILTTQQVDNGGFAVAPEFDSDTFLGWTTNGKDVVDVSTCKITSDTTFTTKFGTWQLLSDEQIYVYGEGRNQEDISISGLKAGEKIKLTINFLKANISPYSDAYWINSPDGNGCYGWVYGGNGHWIPLDEYGNATEDGDMFEDVEISTTNPIVSNMGYSDYGVDNEFTISISCKKNGVLTIEWTDQAGGYIDTMTAWGLYVLR